MDKVSVLYLRFLEGVTYTEETATISFSPLFEIPTHILLTPKQRQNEAFQSSI